jgi:hypothetical protein
MLSNFSHSPLHQETVLAEYRYGIITVKTHQGARTASSTAESHRHFANAGCTNLMKNTTWKLLRSVLIPFACASTIPALADQSMTYTVKTVIVKAVSAIPVPKSLEPANTPAKEKGILLPLTKGKSENKTITETNTDERKILLGKDQIIFESKESKEIVDFAKKKNIYDRPGQT